jgi:hypothetical protein
MVPPEIEHAALRQARRSRRAMDAAACDHA